MEIKVGYGGALQSCVIDNRNYAGSVTANEVSPSFLGKAAVLNALNNPVSSLRLSDLVGFGESVAIVTSDITRPCPTACLMPMVLDELYEGGVQASDVTLVFALGSHRRHSDREKALLAGERAYGEIRCIDSSEDEFVYMGSTHRGTPVDLARTVVEADCVVCLGNIEYHYFAGYSGGCKAVFPGVSTMRSIEANHSLMVDPNSRAGKLEGNPVREDLEEAAAFVGVDFILNVVLNESKQIVGAVAGDPIAAHRAGCKLLDDLYGVQVGQLADIVITSQGGYPKDLNLYQAQKALDNAKHVVREGGVVILVAACQEGYGQAVFKEWMVDAESPDGLIQRLGTHFELGGHKAAAIAKVAKRSSIFLVSEPDPDFEHSCIFTCFPDLQSAYNQALEVVGPDARVLVMPHGGSTFPILVRHN